MDRRQTKTRQAIYDAFVNLMAQTGYEKSQRQGYY